MGEEYRCFVGGLAWATTDGHLEDAFRPFGEVVQSKVISDRETGRSRGFGFVTFADEAAMNEAIKEMNGKELDGRNITVNQAQSRGGGGRDGGGGGGGGGYRGGNGGGATEGAAVVAMVDVRVMIAREEVVEATEEAVVAAATEVAVVDTAEEVVVAPAAAAGGTTARASTEDV